MEEGKAVSVWDYIVTSGVALFVLGVFYKAFEGYKKRIDTAIVEAVKALEKGHIEHELKLQAHEFSINNQALVLEDLKLAWKENNNSLKQFNETVIILTSELKDQHSEMKMLVKDNTEVMKRVSQFLEKRPNG